MIWTFADLVDHLKDVHEFEFDTRAHRNARRAVLRAYRDLPNYNSWSYYSNRRRTLLTAAPQSSGTVAYDHSTRRVTLTGATWPANVTKYRIILAGVHYEVFAWISSTIIELPFENNPGANIAAGASYTLYKEAYPLPIGFRKLVAVYDTEQQREIPIITPGQQHRHAVHCWDRPGVPEYCTVRGGDDWLGGMTLMFVPPPSESRQYDLGIDVDPQPLRIERLTGADASVTQNAAVVTFSSTVIPVHAAGAAIRLSADDTVPTSLIGEGASDGTDVTHAAHVERIILSRDGANQVTLDAPVPDTLTTVGFAISDPLDIEVSSMLTVLQRLAEAEYAKLQKIGEPAQRASYWATFERTLIDAKAADRREVKSGGRPGGHDPFTKTRINTL
jgi:hypothetical protein